MLICEIMGLQPTDFDGTTDADKIRAAHRYDTLVARIEGLFRGMITNIDEIKLVDTPVLSRIVHVEAIMDACGWRQTHFAQAYDPSTGQHHAAGVLPDNFLCRLIMTKNGPVMTQLIAPDDQAIIQFPKEARRPSLSRQSICMMLRSHWWPTSVEPILTGLDLFP